MTPLYMLGPGPRGVTRASLYPCLLYTSYNEEHGIVPKTVRKAINDISSFIAEAEKTVGSKGRSRGDSLGHGAFYTPDENGEGAAPETVAPEQTLAEQLEGLPHDELVRIVETMEEDMRNASAAMDLSLIHI